MNLLLGNYIAIGVNNPKKYPKKPFLASKNTEAHEGFKADSALDTYILSMANKGEK